MMPFVPNMLDNLTGYLIPKGWKVMPLFRNIHHNPEFFPDPKHFDPSRFEVRDNCTVKFILLFSWVPFFSSLYRKANKTEYMAFLILFVLVLADSGCSETKYVYAIWQWRACLSREWACQIGDAYFGPPSGYQVQVCKWHKNLSSPGRGKEELHILIIIFRAPHKEKWYPNTVVFDVSYLDKEFLNGLAKKSEKKYKVILSIQDNWRVGRDEWKS